MDLQSSGREAKRPITELLERWRAGDPEAGHAVAPLVYREMRRIASRLLRRERRGHTLQATALVHEVFVELFQGHGVPWPDRVRFYGFTAHLMRRLLVRHGRRRNTAKRGGQWVRLAFDELRDVPQARTVELEALDGALDALQQHEPRQAKLVELRIFGGLTIAESARFFGCSPSSVHRMWRQAVVFLREDLAGDARGA